MGTFSSGPDSIPASIDQDQFVPQTNSAYDMDTRPLYGCNHCGEDEYDGTACDYCLRKSAPLLFEDSESEQEAPARAFEKEVIPQRHTYNTRANVRAYNLTIDGSSDLATSRCNSSSEKNHTPISHSEDRGDLYPATYPKDQWHSITGAEWRAGKSFRRAPRSVVASNDPQTGNIEKNLVDLDNKIRNMKKRNLQQWQIARVERELEYLEDIYYNSPALSDGQRSL